MVRAVLFDLGDTLFDLCTRDAAPFIVQGIHLAYNQLERDGHRLPERHKYVRHVGRRVTLAYAWSLITLKEVDLQRLIQRSHRRMGIQLDKAATVRYARTTNEPFRHVFRPCPGARQTLQMVQQAGYRIGLISNTMMLAEVLDEALVEADMFEFFECRVYSSDVGVIKPHPRIFQVALERLGTPAAETMYVGDLINRDVAGAKRFGMPTVLRVIDGWLPAGRYRPDHVIRRITELSALLPRCRATTSC